MTRPAAPRERPIIFSGAMVRAILADRKTMTRRLATSPLRKCEPGDLLWVREGFTVYEKEELLADKRFFRRVPTAMYAADFEGFKKPDRDWNWTPSIHMPRWACRIMLQVTGIKIERLQDISEEDAEAEGVEPAIAGPRIRSHRTGFVRLWNELHGDGAWLNNPEVVAISFVRASPPEAPDAG